MARRVNRSWVLLAALLGVSCSRSPDVVAMKEVEEEKADARILRVGGEMNSCRAGHYKGTMATDPTLFAGTIEFSLVQTGNEFKVLQDTSTLSGTIENSEVMFSATIPGNTECRDGVFHTYLENGMYQLPNSMVVRFHGDIDGQYIAFSKSFGGTWSAHLETNPAADAGVNVHGNWSATRISDP